MTDPRAAHCLRTHGFYLAPGPHGLHIFVPAGRDPGDGAALAFASARPATPEMVGWWEQGKYDKIAAVLQKAGVPGIKRRKPWWKRLLGR